MEPLGLKVIVTPRHNLERVKTITNKRCPKTLIMESQFPYLNERTINIARYFLKNGWKQEGIKILTKRRSELEFNLIKITLMTR